MNLIFWRKKVVATRLECPYDEIAWFAKTGVLPLEMSRAAAILLHGGYQDTEFLYRCYGGNPVDLPAWRAAACEMAMSRACADADFDDSSWETPF